MEAHKFRAFQKSLKRMLEIFEPHVNPELDSWYALVDSEKQFNEFLAEVRESHEELKQGKYQELEEELGDTVWDLFSTITKLDDEGKIDASQVFENIRLKINQRKPHLLQGKKISKEEEVFLWNKAKRAEGYPEERMWTAEREEVDKT